MKSRPSEMEEDRVTDTAQSPTDQAQPPAPWLHTPEPVPPPSWAAQGSHPGPAWPSSSTDSSTTGSNGASRAAAAASKLQAISAERPEVIIGAAFAGGLLLALFIKYLAR
jgi:hypothetical protein